MSRLFNNPLFALFFFISALLYSGCDTAEKPAAQDQPAPYPDMVLIPAGEFVMGSDGADARHDEKPSHTVYVDAFYIDRYEVTNAQYQKFIQATGHAPPRVDQEWASEYNWNGTSFPAAKSGHPVVLVSWHDAHRYALWRGKRLPTEAEWEKAARGGLAGMRYPLGDTVTFDDASYDRGYLRSKKIYAIGSFKPNNYGLHDMAGNVWEWCQDWYAENYYKEMPYKNPSGPPEGLYHVFRGGSWISQEQHLRCAQRGKNVPEYKSHAVGFRCALSADRAP